VTPLNVIGAWQWSSRQAVDVFLRRELPGDQDGVFALHAAAFARPGEVIPEEAVLVQALRAAGDIVPELSIVAEQDGEIVGHVVCSRAPSGVAGAFPSPTPHDMDGFHSGNVPVRPSLELADLVKSKGSGVCLSRGVKVLQA
jgi:predicted N-acetyltransferase YhbS